jgi:hypothetical protein
MRKSTSERKLKGDGKMKDLITTISRSLVDQPEQVKVREIKGESSLLIELRVAKEDLGKVIGKQGATAKAMRTILAAASAKIPKRSTLEIIE